MNNEHTPNPSSRLAALGVLVALAMVLPMVGGCAAREVPSGFFSGDEEQGYSVNQEEIGASFVREEGYMVSPSLEAEEPRTRLVFMLDLLGADAPGIEVRHEEAGNGWSEWLPATIHGDGVLKVAYADFGAPSRAAQYRIREEQWSMVDRVHAALIDPVPAEERSAAERASGGLVGRADAPLLDDSLRRLGVHPREDWDADPHLNPGDVDTVSRGHIVIHHTVTPTIDSRTSADRIKQIQGGHVRTRGFNDIGYHFLVDRSGEIWEGTPLPLVGAHIWGLNRGRIGIALLGCFDHTCSPSMLGEPSDAQITATRTLVQELARMFSISVSGETVGGHGQFALPGHGTACPGDRVISRLDRIRSGGPGCVPSAEVCDGLDNNCDGEVDEGDTCTPGLEPPSLVRPDDRSTFELGAAVSFAWERSGSHSGSLHAIKIRRCTDSSCATGVGDPVLDRPSSGTSDTWSPTSSGWYRWVVYVSDGGSEAAPMYRSFEVREPSSCSAGDTTSCMTGLPGVCSSGQRSCSSGSWGACVQDAPPSAEICGNGLDEDCNGVADDGACGAPPVLLRPSNGASFEPGDSIPFSWSRSASTATHYLRVRRCVTSGCTDPALDGTGPLVIEEAVGGTSAPRRLYAEGSYRWVVAYDQGGGWVAPMYRVFEVRSTAVCAPGDRDPCTTGMPGVCRNGERSCVGGSWGSCAPLTSPSSETCDNGRDEDCDGATDEGCAVGPAPRLHTPSDGRPISGSIPFSWSRASGAENRDHYLRVRRCVTFGCTDPALDGTGPLVTEDLVTGTSTTRSYSPGWYRWVVAYRVGSTWYAPMYFTFQAG